ncbi:hypothetical protein LUQ84_001515 [Hamiltosporidium tvaerminnensis]|nr:hypothetical protein LUQ84_001515 [Hamiltosporidium tvaerminnensis]
MKFNKQVSSSRRKNRKRHFNASEEDRTKTMKCTLSKELRSLYGMRALPICVNDTVEVMRGQFKNIKGRVVEVIYKTYKVHVESCEVTKKSGQKVFMPIYYSNLRIHKLHIDEERMSYINRMVQSKKKVVEITSDTRLEVQ